MIPSIIHEGNTYWSNGLNKRGHNELVKIIRCDKTDHGKPQYIARRLRDGKLFILDKRSQSREASCV